MDLDYQLIRDTLEKMVREYHLSAENLTEQQLAEAIRQAIESGDFVRLVSKDGAKQLVTYLPHREVDRLRILYNELLDAVVSKHDGETRHETALRYIRERENCTGSPCQSK
jgi:DeoR/GlpR family transcriptional regulator of sugar metabolism